MAEYRIEVDRSAPLTELRVDVEPAPGSSPDLGERVERAIRDEFLFRPAVRLVAPGSLPRFEGKASRFVEKH